MNKTDASGQTRQWLGEEAFSSACAALPLISIDLIVTRPGHQGRELLLGLRNNRPAQGWWFTPGGRIRKNEPFSEAMSRVARDEIGLDLDCLKRAELLGVWDHFYSDSAFKPDLSTHYVNLPHVLHLSLDEAQTLTLLTGDTAQHQSWRWQPIAEAQRNSKVHNYVRAALERLIEI